MPMNYRSVIIDKKIKSTKFNSTLFYFILFIVAISFSIFLTINIKHEIGVFSNEKIPALKKRIKTIKNSIAFESKNNSDLKRNFIKIKAKELGMVQADYSNIIDIWVNRNKELNE